MKWQTQQRGRTPQKTKPSDVLPLLCALADVGGGLYLAAGETALHAGLRPLFRERQLWHLLTPALWLLGRATSQQEKDSEEEISTPVQRNAGFDGGMHPPEMHTQRARSSHY
jgi:hypothetical protein